MRAVLLTKWLFFLLPIGVAKSTVLTKNKANKQTKNQRKKRKKKKTQIKPLISYMLFKIHSLPYVLCVSGGGTEKQGLRASKCLSFHLFITSDRALCLNISSLKKSRPDCSDCTNNPKYSQYWREGAHHPSIWLGALPFSMQPGPGCCKQVTSKES